jgi:polyhydroxybutyrate depolymerase
MFWSVIAACSGPSGPDTGDSPDATGGAGPDASTGNGSGSGSAAACVGLSAPPRDRSFEVGGRTVRVHVPPSYDPARRTPLVLNLHGYSYDGARQAALSHMLATSDSAGFIAVHPDGHHSPRGWNAGVCCGSAASSGADDTAWILAVLDGLEAELCVDSDRVYATGLSNGAFMAYRLACEAADRFAAVAPVAGVVGTPTCAPSRPVPIFHVHGTSDPIIPYGGGGWNGNEPVATTIDRWVTANACTTTTTTYQHGDATCVTRGGCTDGADVTLCTIDGGGHQWPGGDSIGTISGTKSDDLIATEAMWAFFAAHPRRALVP